MKIIDMRCRPAYLHDFFGKTPGGQDYEVVKWLNTRVGTRGDVEHFTRSATPEGFLAEVEDAGLTKAVVVGRHTPGQHLPNDTIHAITGASPLLEGIGSVDIISQGRQTALDEAERAILTLGLKGIELAGHALVLGLEEVPPKDLPPVAITHLSFDVMVGIEPSTV